MSRRIWTGAISQSIVSYRRISMGVCLIGAFAFMSDYILINVCKSYTRRWRSDNAVEAFDMHQSDCLIHVGQLKHGSLPVTSGVRYILVQSWNVKEPLVGTMTLLPGRGSFGYPETETKPESAVELIDEDDDGREL